MNVSIVQLIANPKRFDGKKVRPQGFLRLTFEGNAIYLHREDYVWCIFTNALWIGVPDDLPIEEWSEILLCSVRAFSEPMIAATGGILRRNKATCSARSSIYGPRSRSDHRTDLGSGDRR